MASKSDIKVLQGLQLQDKENDPAGNVDLSPDLKKLKIDYQKPKDMEIISSFAQKQDKASKGQPAAESSNSGLDSGMNMTKEDYERAIIGSSPYLISSAFAGMEITDDNAAAAAGDGQSTTTMNDEELQKNKIIEGLHRSGIEEGDKEKPRKSRRYRTRKVRVRLAKVQDSAADQSSSVVSTSSSNSGQSHNITFTSTNDQENRTKTHIVKCMDTVEVVQDEAEGKLKFRVKVKTYLFTVDSNTVEKPQEADEEEAVLVNDAIAEGAQMNTSEKMKKKRANKKVKKSANSSKNQKVKEFDAAAVEGFRGNEPVDKLLEFIQG